MEPTGESLRDKDEPKRISDSRESNVDPLRLVELSRRLLALAAREQLASSAGRELMREIEELPSREDRLRVVNSTLTEGLPGRGVLVLSRHRMNQELLKRLLGLGLDLSMTFPISIDGRDRVERTVFGATIYHLAALEGLTSLLRILPPEPALLDSQTKSGETPLVLAVKYGVDPISISRVIRLLQGLGVSLDRRDEGQRHAFHYAFRFPGSSVVRDLLSAWSKRDVVPITRYEAQTALALALLQPPQLLNRLPKQLKKLCEAAVETPDFSGMPVIGLTDLVDRLLPRGKLSFNEQERKELDGRILAFRSALARVRDQRHLIGQGAVTYLTESLLPDSKRNLLVATYDANIGVDAIRSVVSLGGRVDLRLRFEESGDATGLVEVLGGTILHRAVRDQRYDVSKLLLNLQPGLASLSDARGNTPLHTHMLVCAQIGCLTDLSLISELIRSGCPVDAENDAGLRPVDIALRTGDVTVLGLLDRCGAAKPTRESNTEYTVFNDKREEIVVDYRGLLQIVKERIDGLEMSYDESGTQDLRESLSRGYQSTLRETRSLYLTYLYLQAATDILSTKPKYRSSPRAGASLVKLAPSLLFHQSPHSVEGLWEAVEWISDMHLPIQKSRRHFNEGEMMLLLNHPKQQVFDSEVLNPLTRALTSVTRVLDADVYRISHSAVWNLARIGLYTHGFHLLFKHDTESLMGYTSKSGWESVGPSLIERRLGAIRIERFGVSDREFGTGFLFSSEGRDISATLLRRKATAVSKDGSNTAAYQLFSLSPSTVIVPRRGYLMVANPDLGVLVIRNSSLVFGRNTLRHAAYVMAPKPGLRYSHAKLLNMTAEVIEASMKPVLDPSIIKDSGIQKSIYSLIRQLDVFRDYNRRLKFESSSKGAFERDKGSGQVTLSATGGYRAEGFASIVEYLRRRYHGIKRETRDYGSSSKVMPDLGFVMPWFPPWVTHRFVGENGEMQSRLKINGDVLEVLEAFVDESFSERARELDERYGVTRFFQEAGFHTEGELVILDPK